MEKRLIMIFRNKTIIQSTDSLFNECMPLALDALFRTLLCTVAFQSLFHSLRNESCFLKEDISNFVIFLYMCIINVVEDLN